MTAPRHIFIGAEAARLRAYTSSSGRRGGVAVLKLEFEVTDPYLLGDIMRQCAEFNLPQREPEATRPRLLPPPER